VRQTDSEPNVRAAGALPLALRLSEGLDLISSSSYEDLEIRLADDPDSMALGNELLRFAMFGTLLANAPLEARVVRQHHTSLSKRLLGEN
jgi:hypothetical protein